MCHFSLTAFKILFYLFFFSFLRFNYNVYWHGSLYLFLICSASSVCGVLSYTKFGMFYLLFLWILSQPHSHCLLLWDSDNTNVELFIIILHIPEPLVIVLFLNLCSFCCLDQVNSTDLSSSSLSLSCHLHFTTEPIHWGFFKNFSYCILLFL